ncbi:MAG: cyclase [Candidatus Rokuibacteriota bacterium]|nr:MAG: cyclase [Candidatus Rokubacteria bacterium]
MPTRYVPTSRPRSPYLLIRHKVGNYAKWKRAFDAQTAAREVNGSNGGCIFRNASNRREVVVILEWKELEQARAFAESTDLREMLALAGVSDMPDVYVLEPSERTTH